VSRVAADIVWSASRARERSEFRSPTVEHPKRSAASTFLSAAGARDIYASRLSLLLQYYATNL
jgi:hypothetical protein